ncbi:MAG: DUF2202 domain-containing protein [Opitutaceae bacterium]|nr:DUF2202 domain-containing protein [Opitutaceae bacterium]
MKKLILLVLAALVPAAFALTTVDSANLVFLKQEEKMARDVYQVLHAKWGHPTFAAISVSEQRHIDSVTGLLKRYGIKDPTPAAPGVFTIPELQALYDQLIAEGTKSLQDALEVGVLIEETDIDDLQRMLETTRERPISRVLTNLQRGSYNHLEAFTRSLE